MESPPLWPIPMALAIFPNFSSWALPTRRVTPCGLAPTAMPARAFLTSIWPVMVSSAPTASMILPTGVPREHRQVSVAAYSIPSPTIPFLSQMSPFQIPNLHLFFLATAATAGLAAYFLSLGGLGPFEGVDIDSPADLRAYLLKLAYPRGGDNSLNFIYNGVRPSDAGTNNDGPVGLTSVSCLPFSGWGSSMTDFSSLPV